MAGYQLTYNVDMVFCIDSTGSMRHVLDFVKQNALNLYQDITREMEKKHKTIHQLRVKVIAFRDYIADGEEAMLSSDFFTLPEQAEMLRDCVEGIHAKGGGDIPEDGWKRWPTPFAATGPGRGSRSGILSSSGRTRPPMNWAMARSPRGTRRAWRRTSTS